ncbi:MAG TPA: alanine--tRNA ligase-related protein, partial [Verrucomicrobiae bacterium]|nr:alanine--tRNA ligase-related protein [Verrucomicrobiae bacterium]
WSFQFLTSEGEGLGLDPARLYITIFPGNANAPRDEESIGLWKEAFKERGIEALVDVSIAEGGRIFSDSSNWWGPAGQTGPCGPDTEIYYDLGEGVGPLTDATGMPDLEGSRLVEIWNNVFMQYRKEQDESFQPLEHSNVDTGMGLERICAVVQNVPTVFETDLFTSLLGVIAEWAPGSTPESQRIIADHLKAATFLIGDGVFPSNKDRGYIVRRLIRRAVLHTGLEDDGAQLEVLISKLVEAISILYSGIYAIDVAHTVAVLTDEARKFHKSLSKGKKEIERRESLTGKDAFDLYQTYGFPLELTREYAQSKGVQVDEAEFEAEFKKHQDLSRTASAGQFSSGLADHSEQTVKYHTATHLLHQALRDVLGDHVQQKGSNINSERLRFDFAHPEKMTPEQVERVEQLVNEKITADLPISRAEMSPQEAFEQGYIGLFGHKYGDRVSVYDMGGYSKEICTGPHVEHTGTLGKFSIQKEEAVSAGVRRIKAILE